MFISHDSLHLGPFIALRLRLRGGAGCRVLHLANVEELEHDAKGGGVSVSDSMGGGALLHQPGQIADFTCT